MKLRAAGAAIAVAAALGGAFASTGTAQAGRPVPRTTAPDLYVTVNVTMTDTKFVLSAHSAPRGADARFVVHNVGSKTNVFAVGKQGYGTGVQTGFSVSVKPGQKKILILFLDFRGKIPYYSGLAANKRIAGMRGEFVIGPCTHYEQVTGVAEC